MSAPRARDLIVALRAPFFLDLALSARSYASCIHLSLFLIIWYWSSNKFYIIILQMMWITHFLKVIKFLFEFKWYRKFNLLKALSALRNTFSSWHSRSIFCMHFCNFLINYMIKIIYFLPNLSKRKNNLRLYLRKRFSRTTLISYLTYFGEKMEFFQYLKSKHKIYILSRNFSIRMCRPHLGKWFFIRTFFMYLIYFV